METLQQSLDRLISKFEEEAAYHQVWGSSTTAQAYFEAATKLRSVLVAHEILVRPCRTAIYGYGGMEARFNFTPRLEVSRI